MKFRANMFSMVPECRAQTNSNYEKISTPVREELSSYKWWSVEEKTVLMGGEVFTGGY